MHSGVLHRVSPIFVCRASRMPMPTPSSFQFFNLNFLNSWTLCVLLVLSMFSICQKLSQLPWVYPLCTQAFKPLLIRITVCYIWIYSWNIPARTIAAHIAPSTTFIIIRGLHNYKQKRYVTSPPYTFWIYLCIRNSVIFHIYFPENFLQDTSSSPVFVRSISRTTSTVV